MLPFYLLFIVTETWPFDFWNFQLHIIYHKLNSRCWYCSECLDDGLNYSGELLTTFCNVVFSWVHCQDSWHTPCFNGFCILGPGVLLLNNNSFVGKKEVRGCQLITQYKFDVPRDPSPLYDIVMSWQKCIFVTFFQLHAKLRHYGAT